MVSRNTVKSDIMRIYNDEKVKCYQLLDKFKFVYVLAPHTVEVLAQAFSETLIDWNIDRKLSTITVDNCPTNDAMFHHLLDKFPTKDMPIDGINTGSKESSSISGGLGSAMSFVASGTSDAFDDLDMYDQYVTLSSISTTTVTSELDMYLDECVLPRTPDFDILSW
ncbi:hypothetical protein Sango_0808600 [Sesamum angolense]|uniref:Uncharacterized protein n=1 Tax=Sesamum angolense TaxID=2727404 RepID=A0AAE1X366_9LAMI|nr:hypothetical protein Sango_0808600 [Sesamum angolense]